MMNNNFNKTANSDLTFPVSLAPFWVSSRLPHSVVRAEAGVVSSPFYGEGRVLPATPLGSAGTWLFSVNSLFFKLLCDTDPFGPKA